MTKAKTTASKTAKRDVYAIVTDRLLAKLDEGVVPWRKTWTSSAPRNLFSGKAYRGINVIMLATAGYSSPFWMTYKQAAEHGGQVRKGEHGSLVIFWKRNVVEVEDDVTGETKREARFILRYYTVFNAEQVDGVEDYVAKHGDVEARHNDPIAEAEAIIAGYSGRPATTHGGDVACYVPGSDLIMLPTLDSFDDAEAYYTTSFHEHVHSTGAAKRLDRKGVTEPVLFGSHTYAQEELVAEFGAAMLCGLCGIERTLDNSAAYIASWRKALTDNPRWSVIAAAQAQKAADYIIGEQSAEEADAE